MRSLTTNVQGQTTATGTTPGYLVQVNFPTPLYLCSYGSVLWNGITWLASNLSLGGMDVSSASAAQTGQLKVVDTTLGFSALCELYGISNRAVYVWKIYSAAPGASDPILLFQGIANTAQFQPSQASTTVALIQDRLETQMVPRRYISKLTGFNFLTPSGTKVTWGNEIFTLHGSDS